MNSWRKILILWVFAVHICYVQCVDEELEEATDLSRLGDDVQKYIKEILDKYFGDQEQCETQRCWDIFSILKDNISNALVKAEEETQIELNGSIDMLKEELSTLNEDKNKRTTSDTTKKSINSMKRGLVKFFDSLKRLKSKGTGIALDVHNAVKIAVDRILEKLPPRT